MGLMKSLSTRGGTRRGGGDLGVQIRVSPTLDDTKAWFFDRAAVMDRVDAATLKNLRKFGARVRLAARGLIRKRKRPSKPGQAPTDQTGVLKKFIFFSYDVQERSVVIGPVRLPSMIGDALPALEYGGETTVTEWQWRRREDRNKRVAKHRKLAIAARPFMGPALKKHENELPRVWRDSVNVHGN